MAGQHQEKKIGFKTIQLFKDQIFGTGSYGKSARLNVISGLLCAAKIIHKTLFDPTAQQLIAPQREHMQAAIVSIPGKHPFPDKCPCPRELLFLVLVITKNCHRYSRQIPVLHNIDRLYLVLYPCINRRVDISTLPLALQIKGETFHYENNSTISYMLTSNSLTLTVSLYINIVAITIIYVRSGYAHTQEVNNVYEIM